MKIPALTGVTYLVGGTALAAGEHALVSESIPLGAHTLQLNGAAADGTLMSVAAAVHVATWLLVAGAAAVALSVRRRRWA